MVTQDGDHAIGVIISVQLLLYGALSGCPRVQLLLECMRRVEGTEHLRCQTFHIRRQVPVQLSSLRKQGQ